MFGHRAAGSAGWCSPSCLVTARNQIEIAFLDLFCKASPRCSSAFVSELICRCPSKASQTTRGDGVRMHGGKLPVRVYWSRKEWMG